VQENCPIVRDDWIINILFLKENKTYHQREVQVTITSPYAAWIVRGWYANMNE
jgi:hypothetical protein